MTSRKYAPVVAALVAGVVMGATVASPVPAAADGGTASQCADLYDGTPDGAKAYIDCRLDGRSATPAPTATAEPVPTPTPTPTPTTAPISVKVGDGTATLMWQAVDGAKGYSVGRDGIDTNGYRAYSTTDPATARSRVFDKLINGRTYTLFVQAQPNGTRFTIQATPQALATSPSPSTPSPSAEPSASPSSPSTPGDKTPGWLSGAATDDVAGFGSWRGSPLEIGQTWLSARVAYSFVPKSAGCPGCGTYSGFEGPMSISVGNETEQMSFADVAAGKQDAFFNEQASSVQLYRAGKVNFVSPFYEYNGDWMPWSMTRSAQGYADFKAAFARVASIYRARVPGVKIVLPASCGRDVPAASIPDGSAYDVMGCTNYNAYPWSPQGTVWVDRMETLKQRAIAAGKPIGITEWASCGTSRADGCRPSGGGTGGSRESAAFIDNAHDWFSDNAGTGPGQVLFETFFNVGPGQYDNAYWIVDAAEQVNPNQPATANEYRAKF